MKRRFIGLIILGVLLLGLFPTHAQTPAHLRVIHAVPDAPAVDVYINGAVVAKDVVFGGATPHFNLPSGFIQVELRIAGSSDAPIFSNGFDVPPDFAYSLVLYGNSINLQSVLAEDILEPINVGEARVTAIQVISGVDSVDVARADGAPIMTPITFAQPYGTINAPAGVYDLIVTASQSPQALAEFGEIHFQTGFAYTLVAAGSGTDIQTFVVTAPLEADQTDGLVRWVHALGDAPTVDIYVDDTLLVSGLEFGATTGHLAISAGEHVLALRESGLPPNSEAILEDEVTISEGAQTIAILGDLLTLTDDAGEVTPEQAVVQLINLTDEEAEISVNGEAVSADTQSISEALTLAPSELEIEGDAEFSGQAYGGTLYTVLLLPEDNSILSSTPLDVQLVSAPFEQNVEVATVSEVTEAAAPTLPPTLAPQLPEVATEVPVAVEPTAAEVAVQPTLPPVEQLPTSTPVPAQVQQQPAAVNVNPAIQAEPTRPNIYPPVKVVFGLVTLNQGVNLQCREYPSSVARSIGLIPNNTELTIAGIFAPRDETGEFGRLDAIQVDGVPDFSPVLEDGSDAADFAELIPVESLWLNVDWVLEDGTPFGCWVSGQYVEINFEGEKIDEMVEYLELVQGKNIDLIPYNAPGGPRDPDTFVSPQQVSAPTPRAIDNTPTATVNVNQGVNLQLRRTPGADGESLALIPGGSQLRVLSRAEIPPSGVAGSPTSPDWLYGEYLQPTGITVRGWISAQYVLLTLNGRSFEVSEVPLAEEGLLGGFPSGDELLPEPPAAGAAPVAAGSNSAAPVAITPVVPAQNAPTFAPATSEIEGRLLINANANLNLRDRPSSDGLVRYSIPYDAPLTVTGRNGDGTWLEVVVNTPNGDVSGWVASEFVAVFFQGVEYDISQLSIKTGDPDTFGTPTATPVQ